MVPLRRVPRVVEILALASRCVVRHETRELGRGRRNGVDLGALPRPRRRREHLRIQHATPVAVHLERREDGELLRAQRMHALRGDLRRHAHEDRRSVRALVRPPVQLHRLDPSVHAPGLQEMRGILGEETLDLGERVPLRELHGSVPLI
jgi:hypothetical protein